MELINTTKTFVQSMRKAAKGLVSESMRLADALDVIAKQNKYSDWKHVASCSTITNNVNKLDLADGNLRFLNSIDLDFVEARSLKDGFMSPMTYRKMLQSQGLADVRRNPLTGDRFVDISIEGKRFIAETSRTTPYVATFGNEKTKYSSGDVAFGVSVISFTTDWSSGNSKEKGWYVSKYDNQGRVNLSGLSEAGIRRLAFEMGLFISDDSDMCLKFCSSPELHFFTSPAWFSLIEWAKRKPRQMENAEPNSYLGDWPSHVWYAIHKEMQSASLTK